MRVARTEIPADDVGPAGRGPVPSVTLMDLPEVVNGVVDGVAQVLRRRNVRCVVDGPRPMHVTADPALVGRAVLDLLLSAAEAVDPDQGGTVTVRYGRPEAESAAQPDGGQFHLVVRDTGPSFVRRGVGDGPPPPPPIGEGEGGGTRFEIRV